MTAVSDNRRERDPEKTIQVLFEISRSVTQTRDLPDLYRVIHQSLDKIFKVDNFYIALYDSQKDTASFPYYADEKDPSPGEIENFSEFSTLTGLVIRQQSPMIFFRKDIEELAAKWQSKSMGSVSKIWLGVPLAVENRVIGAMVIQDYHSADKYRQSDLELLNAISRHVALAIEKKEAQDKFKNQQMVLEKIVESSPLGIALVQNRVFKWVNREMVNMFGCGSKEEFRDKSVRMIYQTAADYEFAGRTIEDSLTLTGRADYEIDLVKRDGTRFPAHIRLNSADAESPMNWTIATISDISRRRAAEKETYERERLQGVLEMAGAVCHEINQPLQAILGNSELLMMETGAGDKAGNRLASIQTNAARIGKITRKLSGITEYKTVEYPGNTKIVDIWQAGEDA